MSTREQRHWQHLETNKVIRQVRRNRDTKPDTVQTHRRDWIEEYLEDPQRFGDIDLPDHERVRPRGELERRKGNWARALEQLESEYEASSAPPSHVPTTETSGPESVCSSDQAQGTVIGIGPGVCRVEVEGRVVACVLRASLNETHQGFTNVVAVGDKVVVAFSSPNRRGGNGGARGMVEAVLPRRSALVRPDVQCPNLQQVIAANVDRLLIVLSWREPSWWPELVDRYLIAAARNRLAPVICLNKVDLALRESEPKAVLAPYERLGYRVLTTSVFTGEGLTELADLLATGATALAGLSGVGKSSLLSAIDPTLKLRIGDVSVRRHEGRHTTSQVTMHRLSTGGYVVDTPGIREFGLSNLRQADLPMFYPEFSCIGRPCRYADCSHLGEPGCAVPMAIQDGHIAVVRYENYRKIRGSLPT